MLLESLVIFIDHPAFILLAPLFTWIFASQPRLLAPDIRPLDLTYTTLQHVFDL